MSSPLHPVEVTHRKPSLIDVQEAVAVLEILDQLQGEPLTKDQVLLRVGVDDDFLDSSISHTEILLENLCQYPSLLVDVVGLLERL